MVLKRHQSEAASSEEPQAEAARARGAALAEALGARRRDAALNPNQQQTFTPESPSPPQQTEDVLQWRARLDEHLRRVSQRDEERDEAAGGYSTPSGDNHALRERRVPPAPRPLDRAARETATRGNRSLTPDAADQAATQRPGTPAPREPRTFDRDRNLEQVRFEDEQRAPSITSRASSTTLARKKEAELQAAERIAAIKRQQLQLEEELIKKRLDAELHRIEAEGSQAGGSQPERPHREPAAEESARRVDSWFDRHEVSDAAHAVPTPGRRRTVTPERAEERTRTSRERSSSRSQAIDRLADHLQTMARPPPRQVYELPTYSGHPSEWLTFYHSYTESTKRYKFTEYENVARLRAALKGEARECVQHMLASTSRPELILRVLKKNFGRTDLLVDRALEELKRLPALGPSAIDLNTFAIKVMNIVSTLVDLDRRNYGGNPLLIREITERLSPHLRSRWCSYARDNVKTGECEIILLAECLMDESDSELLYSHARAPSRRPAPSHAQTQPQPSRRTMNQNQGTSGAYRRPLPARAQTFATERVDACYCCGNNHKTTECRKLLGMPVRARWDWARTNHVCFKCMNQKHRRETCTARGCGISGCPHSHHIILHEPNRARTENVSTVEAGDNARPSPPRAPAPPAGVTATAQIAAPARRRDATMSHDVTERETTAMTSHAASKVMLKIMPLRLRGPNKEVLCYGMIDEGSTISIIDQALADEVGLQGPQAPLTIQGVGAICLEQPSQRVEASVRGVGGGPTHTMQLRTVPRLGIREQTMPRESIMRLPHLTDLNEACYGNVTPRVLIGADHWYLTLPLEARTGRRSEPIAVRSELGWCIYGCAPRTLRSEEMVMHLQATEPDTGQVNKLLEKGYAEPRYSDIESPASNSNKNPIGIPQEQRADEPKNLGTKELKVLGMYWNAQTDDLGFNTAMVRVPADVRSLTRGPTKREALSAVMSVFDPLGQIAQYTITAKIQLQRICILKVGWDEQLPEREQELFLQWLRKIEYVTALRLPRRCLYTGGDSRHQLHIFTDASEQAYAAAAYWRTEGRPGEPVRVQLVAAKAKVTPIRPISIPRAELQAALIGARLARTLHDEHRVQAEKVVLWTDSRTVLQWVRDNARRYSTFVSHRLGEIAELTEPEQWRWVPTRVNPADDATRADPEREIRNTDRWYTGPEFLLQPEEQWPQEPLQTNEPPLEIIEVCNALQVTDPPLPKIERFSNFDRLIGATARTLQFIELLKKKVRVPLEVRHLASAEHLWMQWAQRRDFPDELRALSRGEPLNRSSRLYELDPQLHEDGLIRMRTRINAAPPSVNKQPVILDGRNPYVRLLILRAHKRAHHAFNETVVNDLRQQFWILHLRPTVRSVARACAYCVLRRARPRDPPLGDLPAARLQPFTRAFNFCAVDLFGPQTVSIGRRTEKRWVALFTCLTTRAVHLEIVHTLSTDSAIMALRRLGARRGWPSVMYSDNGTNLRGCDSELRAAYADWLPALQEHGQLHRMAWHFIAPGAPRQGGAWERMVRTVKTALSATLNARSPKEEIFKTLLAEVEHTVNSRPLTHVSVEPDDPEALTPNHFLLGGSSGVPITGPCDEHDRKAWRASQALADSFWRRWLREYVPLLAPRGSSNSGDHAIVVGDYVLIADPNLPRNTWPRGIVEAVYPGPDGVTRNVDVRTRGGVFRRPTTKLAVLPVNKGSPPRSDRGEDVADASNITSHEPLENLS